MTQKHVWRHFRYLTAVHTADFRLSITVVDVTFDVSVRMRWQWNYFISRRRRYRLRAVDYFCHHVTRWRKTVRWPEVLSTATRHVDVEHEVVSRRSQVRHRRAHESAGSRCGEERRRRVYFRFGCGGGHVASAVERSPERGAAEAAAVGDLVTPGELAARWRHREPVRVT